MHASHHLRQGRLDDFFASWKESPRKFHPQGTGVVAPSVWWHVDLQGDWSLLNVYASMGQSMGYRWIKARNQISTSWKFKFQLFLCAVHCYGVLRWTSNFRCLRIIMLLSWLKFELLLQYESCLDVLVINSERWCCALCYSPELCDSPIPSGKLT